MIVLTAYVYLLPDKIDSALVACRTVREASILEPGCLRYDFFQSPDDNTRIVFVEEWSTMSDLDLHFKQDAFLQFMAKMESCVAKPSDIRIFESSLTT
jgi:quinol monooxygenase YgiN